MTARAQSRKHRGYATQRLLADRWIANGLFPNAVARGAGEPGEDVYRTPAVEVEVKAKDSVALHTALKQAKKRLKPGEIPIVVWRHNGQGESNMDEWTVTVSLYDWEQYERWRRQADRVPVQDG